MIPIFSRRFSRDAVRQFEDCIPATYAAMEEICKRAVEWPRFIGAMTLSEVAEGRRDGKGHGLYFPDTAQIKLNPDMNSLHLYLNFIHENLHHAMPEATDAEINGNYVPWVCLKAADIVITDYDGNTVNVLRKGKSA